MHLRPERGVWGRLWTVAFFVVPPVSPAHLIYSKSMLHCVVEAYLLCQGAFLAALVAPFDDERPTPVCLSVWILEACTRLWRPQQAVESDAPSALVGIACDRETALQSQASPWSLPGCCGGLSDLQLLAGSAWNLCAARQCLPAQLPLRGALTQDA